MSCSARGDGFPVLSFLASLILTIAPIANSNIEKIITYMCVQQEVPTIWGTCRFLVNGHTPEQVVHGPASRVCVLERAYEGQIEIKLV